MEHFKTLKFPAIMCLLLQSTSLYSQHKFNLTVYQDEIRKPSICSITTTSDNKYLISWDNSFSNLDSIKLFRDSQFNNEWECIKVLPYSAKYFKDTLSNSVLNTSKYRISALDRCGNMSLFSDYHKAINLKVFKNNSTYHLEWTEYIGFKALKYNIYSSTIGDSIKLVSSTEGNAFDYLFTGNQAIMFQVEALSSNKCMDGSILTSLSNSFIVSNNTTFENIENSFQLSVYPNPFRTKTTVSFPNCDNKRKTFYLMDLIGNILIAENFYISKFELYRNNLPKGLYILEIRGSKNFRTKVLITE